MKPFILATLLSFFACACSPYTKQIKSLDAAYTAGQIRPNEYFALRSQMLAGDAQWRANVAANMNAAAANINASTANMNAANAITAYNYRTNVLAQPQQVNVYHSGYINYNVNGTIYHRYGY